MSESNNLSSLARSKLQLSLTKESCSLHRWVLLKNSIIRSTPPTPTTTKPNVNPVQGDDDYDDEEEEDETDSFLFPDAGKLVDSSADDVSEEAQWLDSLLETLVDEDDELTPEAHAVALPADDDEDLPLSPLISPMSSSDDLINNQTQFFPSPIAAPYPVPFPALLHAYQDLDSQPPHESQAPPPPPYADPLPYYDMDDVDDLSVPEAIDDTSDDESDAPLTPSLRNSRSTLSLVDPSSIPLPPDRQARTQPLVYVGLDNSDLYPFDLGAPSFPDGQLRTYTDVYPEC